MKKTLAALCLIIFFSIGVNAQERFNQINENGEISTRGTYQQNFQNQIAGQLLEPKNNENYIKT